MQMLGPKADKLRWKMMDKLNDEIDIAINLCKKGSDDMLSEYLNFMVSFTDKKLYIDHKDPLKALLISKSKLVFDTILDLTEFDKLLLTLRSDKKNITNNRFLMERLMNHFRETMRLSNVCVDINIHDWWEINENLIARKSPAVKTKMPKHNPEITHLMLYRRCKHMQPSPSSLKEEKIVYCATCAMESENTQAMNNLDKFKLNVERLPLSNNLDFSSAGVGLLLTDRGAQAQANCRHSWCQLQAKPKK
jgi:hypothetical protein